MKLLKPFSYNPIRYPQQMSLWILVLNKISTPDYHYNDVIMGTIVFQITSLTIVYSTVYSDADQRKHQSSPSLAFVRGIHRGPMNSPHKLPVTRKMFPFDDVIMYVWWHSLCSFDALWGSSMHNWMLWLLWRVDNFSRNAVQQDFIRESCQSGISAVLFRAQPSPRNFGNFKLSVERLYTFPETTTSISWYHRMRFTIDNSELILGLHPANVRRHYFVMTSLIGWVQT